MDHIIAWEVRIIDSLTNVDIDPTQLVNDFFKTAKFNINIVMNRQPSHCRDSLTGQISTGRHGILGALTGIFLGTILIEEISVAVCKRRVDLVFTMILNRSEQVTRD